MADQCYTEIIVNEEEDMPQTPEEKAAYEKMIQEEAAKNALKMEEEKKQRDAEMKAARERLEKQIKEGKADD